MIGPAVRRKYQPTIGIECHVQLKTRSKLFSSADNDAREAPPNTLVNHIDFGLPGALPVLNEAAVQLAARAAFVLGTSPSKFSKFDRKHYFYPDLPMGYQITQYDQPIIVGGQVTIYVDGKPQVVRLNRAHLESDAGKSIHPAGKDYSLVDLNRAGTPLLEIVSEADMHSAAEAKAYVRELYLLMKYADISEANLYYGNMRFDVNVSVSQSEELGTRSETKNLNSFRAVEKAADYEIDRQIELLEKGQPIVQETRGWDDAKQKTISQRGKEEAHDYRYMPDPDLPPVTLDEAYMKKVKAEISDLPDDYRRQLRDIQIDAKTIEDIIAVPETTRLVTRVLAKSNAEHARRVAFWMLQPAADNDQSEPDQLQVTDKQLIKLSQLVSDSQLSSTAAKEVLAELLKSPQDPELIARQKSLLQLSDQNQIAEIVKRVISENPAAANDVRTGEMKAIGFLVGQVMKASQGQANPQVAQTLIKDQLGLQ